MSQDKYRFVVSPENIKGDLVYVDYKGEQVGVYTGMSYVLSGGTNGSSTLTGLSVNILFTQTAIDEGYYDPFDGAVLQKDTVTNFIFSADTENPYTYYVVNTSGDFVKFLELAVYSIDWGDNSPIQFISKDNRDGIKHEYPTNPNTYNITLKQRNPWGTTNIIKTVTTPYVLVKDTNPKGTVYFTPAGGSWSGTSISYDYIFSGDAVNVVSAQTSNNYTNVPFPVSGTTRSRVTELKLYGPQPYKIGVPVISNGQVWGAIDAIENNIYTAYTINGVHYFDYANGVTIFREMSSGFTINNLTAEPITKQEILIKVVDQPQIQTNVFVERGKNSAYERIQRLGEVDNLGDLLNYGYGFFNVEKAD